MTLMSMSSSASLKIGDVARRAGVAPRVIRYYEQQGLLSAPRSENGYRAYDDAHVERITRIAGLVQAGLPTRLVKVLLEAEDACARDEATCPRAVAEQLAEELVAIEARIKCLTRSRDTVREFLHRTHRELLDAAPAAASATSRSSA